MYQINHNNQLFSISKSLAVFVQKEFPQIPFETKNNITVFSVDDTFFSSIECIPNSPRHFYIVFPSRLTKKFRIKRALKRFLITQNNESIQYKGLIIRKADIQLFDSKSNKRCLNHYNNKMRENIIGAIVNNNILIS